MERLEIKKKLIEICRQELHTSIKLQQDAMEEAQKEANEHIGAMHSRFDTFKEEAQAKKNGHARQIYNLMQTLAIIEQIKPQLTKKIQIGSIVETGTVNYFISAYIFNQPVKIGDEQYLCIGLNSPIGKALCDRMAGEYIEFRQKKIKIKEVF